MNWESIRNKGTKEKTGDILGYIWTLYQERIVIIQRDYNFIEFAKILYPCPNTKTVYDLTTMFVVFTFC